MATTGASVEDVGTTELGETGFSMEYDDDNEGPPVLRFRPGGPKEARLNRVRLMETGRYYEAAIARKEIPEDPDAFFSLKIENLPLMTTEDQLRREFEVFGKIGDVYRPIDKDTKRPNRHDKHINKPICVIYLSQQIQERNLFNKIQNQYLLLKI